MHREWDCCKAEPGSPGCKQVDETPGLLGVSWAAVNDSEPNNDSDTAVNESELNSDSTYV